MNSWSRAWVYRGLSSTCANPNQTGRHSCQRNHTRDRSRFFAWGRNVPRRPHHAGNCLADRQLRRLRHNLGSRLPVFHALPLAGANAGTACLFRSRPFGNLPADCWDLYAFYAGLAAWTCGLGTLWRCLGTGRRRSDLPRSLLSAGLLSCRVLVYLFKAGSWSSRPFRYSRPSVGHGMMWLVAVDWLTRWASAFFALDRLRYFHATWHVFVLAAA